MADLRSDVEQLRNDLSGTTNEILERVTEFTRARPHVAVGVALGIGWILGNGLHPRIAMSATRLAYKTLIGGALVGGGFLQALGAEQQQDEGKRTSRASAPSGARRATSESDASPRKGSASRE